MAKTALDLIQEMAKGRTLLNAPLSEFSTIQVGGPADILIYPRDREDLARLLSFLHQREIPVFPLGNGSNLIVRDAGIRGAAINLMEGFRSIERRDAPGQGTAVHIRVEAGSPLRRFIRWTVDQGITGFEALVGIPGSVGGALAMNAGAWGFEIGQRVLELEAMDPTGKTHTFGRDMLRFAYRSLELPKDYIIVGALLEGEEADPRDVKTRAKEFYGRRRKNQPTQEPSAGCVFKNPQGHSAGRLIEQCGLKGVRVGDAEVSRVHANYIVNKGSASAGQVVALMGMVQERVYVDHGIKLEPEVRIVGEWEKGKLRIQE